MSNENKAPGTPRPQRVRVQMGDAPAQVSAPASSPAEQVISRASDTYQVTDPRGRRIVIRRPQVLAEYNFVEMLGESAANQTYLAMVTPVLFIVKIDDDDIPPIVRKSELKAMIQRLDRDGLQAVAAGIQKHFAGEFGGDLDREAVKD